MRRIFLLAVIASMFLVSFSVSGVDTGPWPLPIIVEPEQFIPSVWLDPNGRVVMDDDVEPGRFTNTTCSQGPPNGTGDDILCERINNYAFEGENIYWRVLVIDLNGVEDIASVTATIGTDQVAGNDKEASCSVDTSVSGGDNVSEFNANINGNPITQLNSGSMRVYDCILTVETPDGMIPGQYWVTVEACSDPNDPDSCGTMTENEFWYLNPVVALDVDGIIDFGTVIPGTVKYSNSVTVGNDATPGSGVLLDMFISGTDFYDPDPSGAKCPTTNQLALTNFAYFATQGAYSSTNDIRAPADPLLGNYVPIEYGTNIRDSGEIICNSVGIPTTRTLVSQCAYNAVESYSIGNVLSPGAEITLTFRLDMPMPCSGNFIDGDILFWGEAI